MSDLRNKIESGNYTPDDILDWYDRNATTENVKLLQNQPRENFESIEEFEDDGVIYTIGTENGISVIIDQKKKPEIFGVGLTEAQIGGLKVKQNLSTAGDILSKTPGFLGDAANPINIAKGLNKGVINAFGLVDNLTGGAVTKLDNYLVENFPNTLGKKFEYEKPQGAGGMTGEIIGQYVLTDLFLRRAIPFFNKNMATGLAADATTVGLFSSADEGNLASLLDLIVPESENPGAIAKVISSLQPDADDSEIEGRLKNVMADTTALGAVLSLFKIAKGLITNPKVTDDLVEAQSAGAAATPKEAPTPVVAVDSSGQVIKQADELVTSEKPFYSNVEKTISNFTFKQQPGNQILATLNNTAGIKQSEIQDLGLDTFLKDNPSVTKEQLDDFIANKSLVTRVKNEIIGDKDVFLGTNRFSAPDDLKQATSIDDAVLIVKNNENLFNEFKQLISQGFYGLPKIGELPDDYLQRINKLDGGVGERGLIKQFLKDQYGVKLGEKKTRFDSYVTPGGENYKEMLITAPGTPQVFTDHHFRGEVSAGENLIAHARFNDKTIDGNKILFIEEVQSDLHQAGKKQGYNKPMTEEMKIAFKRAIPLNNREIDKLENEMDKLTGGKNKLTGERTPELIKKEQEILQEIQFLEKNIESMDNSLRSGYTGGDVADAPFKKNWYELTMKRLIKYAVDNDYDGIAFTSGDMQVARYPGMDNPEGLKGFYDKTLTKYTNKFANKYGVSLENKAINFTDMEYKYYSSDFELNKQYTVLDSNNDVFAKYQIVQLDNISHAGKSTILRFTKDGKTSELYRGTSPSTAAEILADRLEGSKVPEIIDKQNSVPFLLFSPDMKKEILTEGVPIAQVEEKENKQQTSAVV